MIVSTRGWISERPAPEGGAVIKRSRSGGARAARTQNVGSSDANPTFSRSKVLKRTRWRRGGDSNPRYGCPYAAFRVRCFQPLSHLSAVPSRAVDARRVVLWYVAKHPG